MESFSFHSASKYFMAAISLHDKEDCNEDLMKIYELALKPLFAVGDFEKLEQVTTALSKSSEERHRLNASYYRVRFLGSRGKYDGKPNCCLQQRRTPQLKLNQSSSTEALPVVLRAIEQLLDEAIPSQITKELISEQAKETMALLSNYSEAQILSLPALSDERKLVRTKNVELAYVSLQLHITPGFFLFDTDGNEVSE